MLVAGVGFCAGAGADFFSAESFGWPDVFNSESPVSWPGFLGAEDAGFDLTSTVRGVLWA